MDVACLGIDILSACSHNANIIAFAQTVNTFAAIVMPIIPTKPIGNYNLAEIISSWTPTKVKPSDGREL